MPQNIRNLVGPMRLPFLILTPACVILGAGAAYWATGQFNFGYFLLVLLGAVCAHISVNALNEYEDFRSGLDFKTQRTPFSGGTGTLPNTPDAAPSALATGLITLGIAAAVGVFFLVVRGWMLLPLGILGLLVIYIYTNWILKNPVASLIAPGLGFGLLMVMGTYYCLTGQYSWTAFVVSLVPTFLVSDLLLLNQFPDVEPDRSVGRRHYPILIGRRKSAVIYGLFLLGAYLAIVAGVIFNLLPVWALIALLTLVLAVPAFRIAYTYPDDMQKIAPAMGQNVMVNILTPLLLGIILFVVQLIA